MTHAARAAAVLDGKFHAVLVDRDAGVWRDPLPSAQRPRPPHQAPVGTIDTFLFPTTLSRPVGRRVLRMGRKRRLGAAIRVLTGGPEVFQTLALWTKALGHFPTAIPDMATSEGIVIVHADVLADAERFGAVNGQQTLRAATVVAAVRAAPRGFPPGASGLRMEHHWALDQGGRDALVDVVLLLASSTAVYVVPQMATHALAGANLILLVKPGPCDGD